MSKELDERLSYLNEEITDPSRTEGQRIAFGLLGVAEALAEIAASLHQLVRSDSTDLSYGIRDIVMEMQRAREGSDA